MSDSKEDAGPIKHDIAVVHQTLRNIRANVLIAGDAACGKTTLCKMLQSNGTDYPKNYVTTVAPELFVRALKVPRAAVPTQVELHLVDMPGSNTFSATKDTPGSAIWKHWATASAIAVVFDISSRDSFQAVEKWLRRAIEARVEAAAAAAAATGSTAPPAPVAAPLGVLIGAKKDTRDPEVDRAEVATEDAKALAEQCKMGYFEVSAEKGDGWMEPFAHLAAGITERYEHEMARVAEQLGSGAGGSS